MSQRQTLADSGLKRCTVQNKPRSMYAFLEGKADPVAVARNGQSFYTDTIEDLPTTNPLNQISFTYVKDAAEKTLVVFSAFLQSFAGVRYTDMRAWQMIVDAWLTADGNQPAGTPEGLRYLAFHDVTEDESKTALKKEMNEQWAAGRVLRTDPPEIVEYTSDSPNWLTNPWIRCSQRVAAGLSTPTQQISVSRAWSVFMGSVGGIDELHLIVELTATPVEAEA